MVAICQCIAFTVLVQWGGGGCEGSLVGECGGQSRWKRWGEEAARLAASAGWCCACYRRSGGAPVAATPESLTVDDGTATCPLLRMIPRRPHPLAKY